MASTCPVRAPPLQPYHVCACMCFQVLQTAIKFAKLHQSQQPLQALQHHMTAAPHLAQHLLLLLLPAASALPPVHQDGYYEALEQAAAATTAAAAGQEGAAATAAAAGEAAPCEATAADGPLDGGMLLDVFRQVLPLLQQLLDPSSWILPSFAQHLLQQLMVADPFAAGATDAMDVDEGQALVEAAQAYGCEGGGSLAHGSALQPAARVASAGGAAAEAIAEGAAQKEAARQASTAEREAEVASAQEATATGSAQEAAAREVTPAAAAETQEAAAQEAARATTQEATREVTPTASAEAAGQATAAKGAAARAAAEAADQEAAAARTAHKAPAKAAKAALAEGASEGTTQAPTQVSSSQVSTRQQHPRKAGIHSDAMNPQGTSLLPPQAPVSPEAAAAALTPSPSPPAFAEPLLCGTSRRCSSLGQTDAAAVVAVAGAGVQVPRCEQGSSCCLHSAAESGPLAGVSKKGLSWQQQQQQEQHAVVQWDQQQQQVKGQQRQGEQAKQQHSMQPSMQQGVGQPCLGTGARNGHQQQQQLSQQHQQNQPHHRQLQPPPPPPPPPQPSTLLALQDGTYKQQQRCELQPQPQPSWQLRLPNQQLKPHAPNPPPPPALKPKSSASALAPLPPSLPKLRLLQSSEVSLPSFRLPVQSRGLPKKQQVEVQEAALLLLFLTCAQSWLDDPPEHAAATAMQLVIPLQYLRAQELRSAVEYDFEILWEAVVREREGRVFIRCDHEGRACRAGGCVRLAGNYQHTILQHEFLKEHRDWLVKELEEDLRRRSGSALQHLQLHIYKHMLSEKELVLYQQVSS